MSWHEALGLCTLETGHAASVCHRMEYSQGLTSCGGAGPPACTEESQTQDSPTVRSHRHNGVTDREVTVRKESQSERSHRQKSQSERSHSQRGVTDTEESQKEMSHRQKEVTDREESQTHRSLRQTGVREKSQPEVLMIYCLMSHQWSCDYSTSMSAISNLACADFWPQVMLGGWQVVAKFHTCCDCDSHTLSVSVC